MCICNSNINSVYKYKFIFKKITLYCIFMTQEVVFFESSKYNLSVLYLLNVLNISTIF